MSEANGDTAPQPPQRLSSIVVIGGAADYRFPARLTFAQRPLLQCGVNFQSKTNWNSNSLAILMKYSKIREWVNSIHGSGFDQSHLLVLT